MCLIFVSSRVVLLQLGASSALEHIAPRIASLTVHLSVAGLEQVVEEASYSGIILPSPEWHPLTFRGPVAWLRYRVRVQCDMHYFNATCTKFCRPRDDKFGHYTCDPNGDKVCIAGWMGANCEIGECNNECNGVKPVEWQKHKGLRSSQWEARANQVRVGRGTAITGADCRLLDRWRHTLPRRISLLSSLNACYRLVRTRKSFFASRFRFR